MTEEPDVEVDHSAVNRPAVKYASLPDQQSCGGKCSIGSVRRQVETYAKVNGSWEYLYRTDDKAGGRCDMCQRRTHANDPKHLVVRRSLCIQRSGSGRLPDKRILHPRSSLPTKAFSDGIRPHIQAEDEKEQSGLRRPKAPGLVTRRRSNRERACLRRGIASGDTRPIQYAPERPDIVRAAVLIFQIIGMLPNVIAKQGVLALNERRVLIWTRNERELAFPIDKDQRPAGAEHFCGGKIEIRLQLVESA